MEGLPVGESTMKDMKGMKVFWFFFMFFMSFMVNIKLNDYKTKLVIPSFKRTTLKLRRRPCFISASFM